MAQELCVLEAMKMKNVIRAPRAGNNRQSSVTLGQHHDLLVELQGRRMDINRFD